MRKIFPGKSRHAKAEQQSRLRQAYQNPAADHSVNLAAIDTEVSDNRLILTTRNLVLPYNLGQVADLRLQGVVRMQIIGENGCGKFTLLALLKQKIAPVRGEARIHVPFANLAQQTRPAHLQESPSALPPDLHSPFSESEMHSQLAHLGLTANHLVQPIGQLLSAQEK